MGDGSLLLCSGGDRGCGGLGERCFFLSFGNNGCKIIRVIAASES
jgi:hypothetical protein